MAEEKRILNNNDMENTSGGYIWESIDKKSKEFIEGRGWEYVHHYVHPDIVIRDAERESYPGFITMYTKPADKEYTTLSDLKKHGKRNCTWKKL